ARTRRRCRGRAGKQKRLQCRFGDSPPRLLGLRMTGYVERFQFVSVNPAAHRRRADAKLLRYVLNRIGDTHGAKSPPADCMAQPEQGSTRIKEEFGLAFDEHISSTKPQATMTAALELALEEFFNDKGFWPRKKATRE